MAYFFNRLKEAAAAAAAEAVQRVEAASAAFNLDVLQSTYGDPTGRRAVFEGLDVTYLTPRLIGARRGTRGRLYRRSLWSGCA
jgi:hypothetical protein